MAWSGFSSVKSVFSSLRGTFKNLEKDMDQMEKDFENIDQDFEKAENEGNITVKHELRPDGTQVITKTMIKSAQSKPPVSAPPVSAPPVSADVKGPVLEAALWKHVYYRVKNFWPSRATLLAFDGKHYSIGVVDLENRKFDVKGVGTSIEDAVRDVERKFTMTNVSP